MQSLISSAIKMKGVPVMAGKKRSVRLKSICDVNRFLAKIINMLNRDEINAQKAGRLGYLCNLLIGGLKDGDIEERICELEKMVENKDEK